jgi:hypothetical protein
MKLPNLPLLEKKPKVEYFLALLLRDEKASALIVEQAQGKITIIGKHESFFTSNLEHATEEEIGQVLDTAISGAEETIPANVEVKNTIFGVKDTWVEEKSIKKDYLAKLKQLCHQLDLVPMGFIVISEALAHLIQKEEGAPLSALLTEVGKYSATVSLFRAGKLIETKHGPIEDTPMATVDSLLKRFERVEIFPSRVILFHAGIVDTGTDVANANDSLAQKFIAHQWSKSLPFLHVPQVSILPAGFDGKAIVAGAATQLGYEMVGLPVDIKDTGIKTYEKHHEIASEKAIEKETADEKAIEQKEESQIVEDESDLPTETLSKVKADNFGFIREQDVATMPIIETPDEDEELIDEESEKVDHHKGQKETEELDEEENDDEEYFREEDADEEQVAPKRKHSGIKFSPIGAFAGIFSPMKRARLPKMKIPLGGKLTLFIPLLLLLIVGIVSLYIFKLKATVALVVAPKMIDESQKVIFSPSAENDFSQGVIAAKEVTISLDGDSSTNTSGQKEVGDKAKGTVTIYNSDEAKKTLNAGTVLTSSNGLDFITDKDIVIASASGDIFSGVKSGTAQVSVVAKNIGSDYNLPSNTKFSVSGSSVLAAKNDSAFSGGSKKKVTVVAKKDTDKLLIDLPKSLEQKAREQLGSKLSNDEVLLSQFTEESFEKKDFDKNVDEQATTVKLTGTVKFTAVAYRKDDVVQYAQTALKNKYSQDQTIPEKDIASSVSGVKQREDKNISAVLDIKAGLLPRLDTPKIAKTITGKSYSDVQEYVRGLPQVERADISLSPGIPFLPKLLPRMTDNITIVVKAHE